MTTSSEAGKTIKRFAYLMGIFAFCIGTGPITEEKNVVISQEEPLFQKQYLSDEENDAAAFSVYLSGNDVYVAGMERKYGTDPNSLEPYTSIATIWKNGSVFQRLSDGKYNSAANSVFVSDNDVYSVGYESNGNPKFKGGGLFGFIQMGPVFQRHFNEESGGEALGNHSSATIWKNGMVHQHLSNGKKSEEAKSVFVSNKDMYVAVETDSPGYDKSNARLYKNGKEQSLVGVNNNKQSVANSIFISGNDVYVAGAMCDSKEKITPNFLTGRIKIQKFPPYAVIWKNGKIYQKLTDGKYEGEAYSVFVSENDVYVAGVEANSLGMGFPTIWKNGKVLYRLGDAKWRGNAKSLFVSGNDVYVAGWERSGSKYTDTSIAVGIRSDVAITGQLYDIVKNSAEMNYRVAVLWKNGQVYSKFGDGNSASEAHSVVVSGDDIYVAGFITTLIGNRVATLWKGK